MKLKAIIGIVWGILFCSKIYGISFKAHFEPSVIRLGEQAYWVLTAEGATIQENKFLQPKIPNLNLRYLSGAFSTRIINGVKTVSTTWRFSAVPQKEGTFIIDNCKINVQGTTYTIPAARLEVVASDQRQEETNDPVLLSITTALPEIWYVGQPKPVEVQLFIKPNIRGQLNDILQKQGDNFSATHLIDNPQKKETIRNNQAFTCLSWNTLITPLTSGHNTLQFSLELLLDAPQRRGSIFDDDDPLSLFSQLGSMLNHQQVFNAKTQNHTIEIAPLPTPIPENFQKAIGYFQMNTPSVFEKEAVQNEAITLCVKVHGQGNFDKMEAPKLNFDPEVWRTYEPKSLFEPSDTLSYSGTIQYEYLIVPLKSGELTLPTLSFCYLDINEHRYVTLEKKAPMSIMVKPPAHAVISNTSVTTDTVLLQEPKAIDYTTQPASWENTHCIYQKTWFWLLNGLQTLLVIIASLVIHRRNKKHNSPYYQQIKRFHQMIQKDEKMMQKAFKNQEGTEFYKHAFLLLQNLFALRFLQQFGQNIQTETDFTEKLKQLNISLKADETQMLQDIEMNYQLCQFGQSSCTCPQNLSALNNLMKKIK